MLKKILLIIAMLYTAAAMAAVDANKATAAELDGIKGIGPGLSSKILDERRNGAFKDWNDFIARVGGVGEKTAVRLSAEGLTVNDRTYSAAGAAKPRAKTGKADQPEKSGKPAQSGNATQSVTRKDGGAAAATPAAQTSVSAAPSAQANANATKK